MGAYTTNSYFWKPSLGASGATELAKFDAALDVADAAIKTNLDGLAAKQPLDTGLTSIAALTTAADKMIYTTALDTYVVTSLTAFARTILDDADAATVRATIGVGTGTVDTSGTPVDNDFAKFTDADTIEGRSYSEVKQDLDLEIGTDVLAQQTIGIADNNLVEIDHASVADNDYAKFTTVGLEGRSYSEVRTDLGLVIGTNVAAAGANTDLSSILNTALYIGRDADNQIKFATDNNIIFRTNGVDGALFYSTGELDMNAHSVGFTLQTATGDGTTTIDWKLGNHFKFTFGAQADTLTFTAPTNPCHLYLIVKQDGTGGRDLTLPGSVTWLQTEPTWTDGGVSKTIVVGLVWDGTTYWAGATEWEA